MAVDRLVRARKTAHDAGDLVARAVAASAAARLSGEIDDVSQEHLGDGWQRVIDELAGIVPQPT